MSRHRGHRPLPKGNIANKPGEIAKHGKHVDLVAKTSYGTHQVRVKEFSGTEYAFDSVTGECLGEFDRLDDQHNFAPGTISGGLESINVNHPDYWANRDDRELPNSPGTFDPRGTAMGGYNPRK